MSLQVLVIGAGAAGLCAARHLLRHGSAHFAPPVVIEMSDIVGGTWIYTDKVGKDNNGNPVHSSMYKNMKTNLPKEVMAFPDFQFKNETESFLPHAKIRKYLDEYCDHFNIRKLIKFQTRVDMVKPVVDQSSAKTTWEVKWTDQKSGDEGGGKFDAVFVCNGHYAVPHYGQVVDIDKFEGIRTHSHDYRVPDAYSGKNVAVLGAAASGIDIGLEIASKASKVYLCHNRPKLQAPLPQNMEQAAGIESCLGPKSLKLTDGSTLDDIDVIMYCTGYEFAYPFLHEDCDIKVEGRLIHTLFKHLINTSHATMCLVGVPLQICPFPLFDVQVRWFCRVLMGDSKLPSKEDMISDTKEELRRLIEEGIPERHFHRFGKRQWPYNDDIAKLANEAGIPKHVEKLYNAVHDRRTVDVVDYKGDVITWNKDGTYTLIPKHERQKS